MLGMRARKDLVTFAVVSLLSFGCGSSTETRRSTTTSTVSEGEAEGVARGKVACRLHSCAPPRYCNEETGVCELLSCTSKGDCPYNYKCDLSINACR